MNDRDILHYLSPIFAVYLLMRVPQLAARRNLFTGENLMSKARIIASVLLLLFVTAATVLFVIS